MFTTLPKLIDKQFVIGFVLPLVCFAMSAGLLFRPQALATIAKALWAEKDITDAAILASALWLGAVALMMLNRVLHRLLCGYYWPLNLAWLREAERKHWDREHAVILAGLDGRGQRRPEVDRIAHNQRRYNFARDFPPTREAVLATRFGNVVRAYERYANQAYGIDGVVAWPRLACLINADLRAQVGDGRAQVDCFTNLTILSLALGLWAGGAWAILAGANHHQAPLSLVGWALLACGLAWFFYRLAIERARALGDSVRAAVDLGLPALVAALGYALPVTREGQRALFKDLSRTFYYFEPVGRPWIKSKT